jgi:ABC-type phosphate/phosphonate transport system substrate-binding protein
MMEKMLFFWSLVAMVELDGFFPVCAGTWQEKFPTVQFSRISSENESDRVARHKRLIAYLERVWGVKVKMHVERAAARPTWPQRRSYSAIPLRAGLMDFLRSHQS